MSLLKPWTCSVCHWCVAQHIADMAVFALNTPKHCILISVAVAVVIVFLLVLVFVLVLLKFVFVFLFLVLFLFLLWLCHKLFFPYALPFAPAGVGGLTSSK